MSGDDGKVGGPYGTPEAVMRPINSEGNLRCAACSRGHRRCRPALRSGCDARGWWWWFCSWRNLCLLAAPRSVATATITHIHERQVLEKVIYKMGHTEISCNKNNMSRTMIIRHIWLRGLLGMTHGARWTPAQT